MIREEMTCGECKSYAEKETHPIIGRNFNDNDCFGCGMCAAGCPNDAIIMVINDSGFLVPRINHDECLWCGVCNDVCPVLSANTVAIAGSDVLAVRAKSTGIRLASSSGGVAASLAFSWLREGYCFIGAVWGDEFKTVEHRVCAQPIEVLETMGSKYVQSLTTSAVKAFIEGPYKKGIFIGTPCQVAGMRNLLGLVGQVEKDCLLIDFFCHGVPSYKLWDKYVNYLSKQVGAIIHLEQRFKTVDWHKFNTRVIGSRGIYLKSFTQDFFFNFYLANYALRQPCYSCPFVSRSAADIRIGDFWGEKFNSDILGVSIVIPLTDKGDRWIRGTEGLYWESLGAFNIAESQGELSEQRFAVPRRNQEFMSDLSRYSLQWLYIKYIALSDLGNSLPRLVPDPLKKVVKILLRLSNEG